MTVDILCSVVDNLGDIGFAYRLARTLNDTFQIRLIVDDLDSFATICEGVEPFLSVQTRSFGTVIQWNNPCEEVFRLFKATKPRIIIETYACGRPSWFEDILFDPKDQSHRHIINIDYLTAESWAQEYHLLPSITRSPNVTKVFFMPGFVQETGGLLQDRQSIALRQLCKTSLGREKLRKEILPSAAIDTFWVLVFSYEHDFTFIIQDLASFHSFRSVTVILAFGRSAEPFLLAWKSAGSPFPVFLLPPVPQNTWDSILVSVDFAFVRGEESFAQVSLSGIPFVWECYPFVEKTKDGYQPYHAVLGHWPKVKAFLKLVSPYMNSELFAMYEQLTQSFNGITPLKSGELLSVLLSLEPKSSELGLNASDLTNAFVAFSRSVHKGGNLATNLLEYIHKIG